MKGLVSITLAVLLVVSLGITMFPTQSAEASPPGDCVFTITAKGQGDSWLASNTGEGEFTISVRGQAGSKGGWWISYAPYVEVAGYVKGSFDGHRINAALHGVGGINTIRFTGNYQTIREGNIVYFPIIIHVHGLYLSGTFDGEPIKGFANNHVVAYYEPASQSENITIEATLWLPSIGKQLRIWLYNWGDKATDDFKVEIREIGN